MKTTLLSIGLGVTLLSTTAFADEGGRGRHRHEDRHDHRHDGRHPGRGHAWHQGHTGDDCNYRAPTAQGRYELRSVSKWVPGGYTNVWVPQQCYAGWRGQQRCTGGYYSQQWQAGHYETVQDWVYVPHHNYYGAATFAEPPPPVGGTAYVNAQSGGFGLSFSSVF